MPISPEYLPTELHYIIALAEQHGSAARVTQFDEKLGRRVPHAEKLSAKDIQSLRLLYNEISSKDHGPLINRWHRDSRKAKCPPETSFPIYGLLVLFAQLGDRGVVPFNDGAAHPQEEKLTSLKLDWTKLPRPLRYLAGPAEVYGGYQFDEPIIDFLSERMTAEEKADLISLNRRWDQDRVAIDRWLEEYPMTEHPEARLVYCTMRLLGTGIDIGLL